MKAYITTYGGKNHTVQHWVLHIGDTFIMDTADPEKAKLLQEVARRWNEAE